MPWVPLGLSHCLSLKGDHARLWSAIPLLINFPFFSSSKHTLEFFPVHSQEPSTHAFSLSAGLGSPLRVIHPFLHQQEA